MILISSSTFDQSTVKLDSYFSQLRSGKSSGISSEVLKPENADTVLNVLQIYASDTVVVVWSKAKLGRE